MDELKKIFREENITYKKVIIFSVICGIITGIIPLIGVLGKTSIHNVSVCFEMWIFLAMYIILKSKKPVEAGIKTFIFFLISQPLCYLVQVPFYRDGFGIFMYYPYWFKLTLLTLPGGMIAWYTKKENILSMLILSVANGLLVFELYTHFIELINKFPYQMLAVLFIIFELLFFINVIFKDKKKKIILYISLIVMLIPIIAIKYINNHSNIPQIKTAVLTLDEDVEYALIYKDEEIDVDIDGNMIIASGRDTGRYIFKIKDGNGNTIDMSFEVMDDGSNLEVIE